MSNLIRRVWSEIRRGENVDVYLTIVVALILSLLNVLGLAPSSIIPAITLAVLALLALASLVSRHKMEDLSEKLSSTTRDGFIEEFDNQLFKNDLDAAHEIWFYGASLDGIPTQYYSLLEQKLKHSCKIRVLVIDPNDSRVLELSEMRAYANPDVHRAQVKVLATLSDFCELRKLAPAKLQIRTLKFPITHRLIALNPSEPNGKLYISNYPFGTSGGSLPKFQLSGKDGRWFDLYRDEAVNLWKAGMDWPS